MNIIHILIFHIYIFSHILSHFEPFKLTLSLQHNCRLTERRDGTIHLKGDTLFYLIQSNNKEHPMASLMQKIIRNIFTSLRFLKKGEQKKNKKKQKKKKRRRNKYGFCLKHKVHVYDIEVGHYLFFKTISVSK